MLEASLRWLLSTALKTLFRVELRGFEHYEAVRGKRCVIIANHQSFLDPMLLATFMPEKPGFAMNVHQAKKWYFKPLMAMLDVYKVDPAMPISTKSIIQRLKGGGKVVIFPEGRITVSGGIMKIYDGTGLIIDRTDALILPVHIDGAQYSHLSRMQGKLKLRWFPKITLTMQPPQPLNLPENLHGKHRRAASARRIYDLMTEAAFHSADWKKPLLQAVLDARKRHGGKRVVAVDAFKNKLTYRSLFTRAFALSGALKTQFDDAPNVGVLLPTTLAGIVTFIALHMLGRTPAMLNFSAGERNLLAAAEMAQLKTIITSRAFVEQARLNDVVEKLGARCIVIYLEDVRERIGMAGKLAAVGKNLCPNYALRHVLNAVDPQTSAAAILYTSGSEGLPKGVVLSHANMLANIAQAAACLNFTQRDVLLNALPIFHSFGLTVGTVLPLVLGIKAVVHPSPLHYRVIPELSYDENATIILGTDTFYSGYAKYAHAYDFHAVRLAVAGAEKLKPATRQLYTERFRVNIMEGYGVTETAPAISINTPAWQKVGSVGRPFPGMECRLEPVEGLEEGGRLLVRGPNVMLGYLKADKPGVLQTDALENGWYDTGDIVLIDREGFIHIRGRAKRFAKVGGEMVSLAAIEELAARLYPDHAHAAISLPDARKGEQVLLFSECAELTREAYVAAAKAEGHAEISFPRQVTHREQLPRLGSGKLDYMTLKEQSVSPSQ